MKQPVAKLKARADTPVGSLAGSISKNLDEGKVIEITAIGASAINQTVKALATAEGHAGSKGRELWYKHGFDTTEVDNGAGGTESRTCVVTRVRYAD